MYVNILISRILKEIIKVIKYAIPWRLTEAISYTTVYSSYKRLLHFNIIKSTYIDLYLKKSPNKKLKIQYTDTTCIPNKYGPELVKYNGYKKKNVQKFHSLLIHMVFQLMQVYTMENNVTVKF